MNGSPTKQARKLPDGRIAHGVWLPCKDTNEAAAVLAVLNHMIEQIAEHAKQVREEN